MTSISRPPPEFTVAELQDASRTTDNSMKPIEMLRPTGGDQPGLATRTIFPPFQLYVRAQGSSEGSSGDDPSWSAYLAADMTVIVDRCGSSTVHHLCAA